MSRTPSMDAVAELLREAAALAVLPRFRTLAHGDVQEKAPGELVTIADHEAEAWLTPRLTALLPGSRVVGEEATAAQPRLLDHLDDEAVWLLDPLDGTGNFVRGDPQFAMLVSLLRRGETVAAWLYHPTRGEMTRVQLGAGAWRLDASGATVRLQVPLSVPPPVPPEVPRPLQGVAKWRYMPAALRAPFARGISPDRAVLAEGTGATGCDYPTLVAGDWQFLLMWRLLPWDHAPGTLLVSEAGGHVAHFDGRPYRASQDPWGLIATHSAEGWAQVRALLPL